MSKKRAKNLIFSLLFLTFFSFSTTGFRTVQKKSKLAYLMDNVVKNEYGFFHSEIVFDNSQNEGSKNAESLQLSIKSDLTNYSSYLLFGNDYPIEYELSSTELDYTFTSKIMYLPLRYDINRQYMEIIRLRQHRTTIDSKYIESGYDFSFYISSIIADKIIASSSTINTYDDILDFNNGVGVSYAIKLNNQPLIGHVRNIYYIEDNNRISKSLNQYLGNFIILNGSKAKNTILAQDSFIVGYDFLSTYKSLENNLAFLKSIKHEPKIRVNDETLDKNISVELSKLIYWNPTQQLLVSPWYILPISVTCLLIISCISIRLLGKTRIMSKPTFENLSIFFITLILYWFLIKLASFFNFSIMAYYLLSNLIFGSFSFLFIILYTLYILIYVNEIKKFYNRVGG